MDGSVEVQENHFRITTQVFSFTGPDTPANRKVAVVVLRSRTAGAGWLLCTLQQLAHLVGSPNRQAASEHGERFRACGEALQALIRRKRQVDAAVAQLSCADLRRVVRQQCEQGTAHSQELH